MAFDLFSAITYLVAPLRRRSLQPFGPGDVPTHRLIRAGVIATTEALGDFTWHMDGKDAAMHPVPNQPDACHLTCSQDFWPAQIRQATTRPGDRTPAPASAGV